MMGHRSFYTKGFVTLHSPQDDDNYYTALGKLDGAGRIISAARSKLFHDKATRLDVAKDLVEVNRLVTDAIEYLKGNPKQKLSKPRQSSRADKEEVEFDVDGL